MSKRLWLLGVLGLVSIGLLMACGSKYNSSSNGLLLVGSQGSSVIQTFSFGLNNGHVSSIANSVNDTGNKTCILNGLPASMVVDPAGTYAYVIMNASSLCPGSETGIAAFKINSDGTTTSVGNLVSFAQATITIQGAAPPNTEPVPVVPYAISIDSVGKFVFVADRATSDSASRFVPGGVSVFAVGTGGSLTEVTGSPFYNPTVPMTLSQAGFDIVAVAATPTVFPKIGINGIQNAVCSAPGTNPPTSEFLYAVDQLGNQLLEYQVNTTSGVLTVPTTNPGLFATDQIPAGVAVDPCDRFVYVSDSLTNRISAYTICSQITGTCPNADGALVPVAGSPFPLSGSANGPGPIVVDPFGNNVYVVGTLSNTLSLFKISTVSGGLTAMNPATVVTGSRPTSITIRADDNWMFVSNYNSGSVSQYSITPASGDLAAAAPITTDNQPYGVAVK